MYLIFPWAKRPWLLLGFVAAYIACLLFGGDADGTVAYAFTGIEIAMLIQAGVGLIGTIWSSSEQASAAKEAADLRAKAARDAANTPQAIAARKLAAEAAARIEDDDYEGLTVQQKRALMQQSLEGFHAATMGQEIELRRIAGQEGFGRSPKVQEALAEITDAAKDVSAKTATAADKLSNEIAQMEKSRDISIVQGTPDTKAQSLLQIGAAKAQEAQQVGEAWSSGIAGVAGLAGQVALQDIPMGYQPWWSKEPLREIDPRLYAYHYGMPQGSLGVRGGGTGGTGGVPVLPGVGSTGYLSGRYARDAVHGLGGPNPLGTYTPTF